MKPIKVFKAVKKDMTIKRTRNDEDLRDKNIFCTRVCFSLLLLYKYQGEIPSLSPDLS